MWAPLIMTRWLALAWAAHLRAAWAGSRELQTRLETALKSIRTNPFSKSQGKSCREHFFLAVYIYTWCVCVSEVKEQL